MSYKRIIICLITLLAFSTVDAQDLSKETQVLKCVNAAFPDSGVAFNKAALNFEQDFFKLNGLNSTTPADYRNLLTKLMNNADAGLKLPQTSLSALVSSLEQPDELALMNCAENMESNEQSFSVNMELLMEFSQKNYSLSTPEYKKALAKLILEKFTNKELEHFFIRMSIIDELATEKFTPELESYEELEDGGLIEDNTPVRN